jgi:hypothetical protein
MLRIWARYAAAKSQILSTKLKDGVPVHILASLVAGTVATTVCAPADVVKSRLQSSSSLGGKRSVRFERHGQDMVADAAAGGHESPAGIFAGGRPVFPDARMDASVAQTDVGDSSFLMRFLLMISLGQTPC